LIFIVVLSALQLRVFPGSRSGPARSTCPAWEAEPGVRSGREVGAIAFQMKIFSFFWFSLFHKHLFLFLALFHCRTWSFSPISFFVSFSGAVGFDVCSSVVTLPSAPVFSSFFF